MVHYAAVVFLTEFCYYIIMKLTASYKKSGKWYIGWVEEISGVNTQGKTLKECKENLKDALLLVTEVNRVLNKKDFGGQGTTREPLVISK